jgi:hypothetical protein
MTMQPDDTPGAFALLDSLDEPGPAAPIGDANARLMIQNAIARTMAPMRPPRHFARYAVAATICVAIAGTAAAAIWYTKSKPVQELPAPAAPVPPHIEPPPLPPAPAIEPPPAPAITPHKPSAAQDLLRQANERRAQRRWRDAQALYRRVEREYPGSSPAYVAMLAEASLRLEHLHDAKGALALYHGAFAKGPATLREEAAFGVIECYHALHRTKDEKRALEKFVAEHPDSPVAPRARERLQELTH